MTDKQIENCVTSELRNLMSEFELGTLTKETLISYVGTMLLDAQVDSRIIVKVLDKFGKEGKDMSMCIKVTEGRSEERRVGKECRSRWSP